MLATSAIAVQFDPLQVAASSRGSYQLILILIGVRVVVQCVMAWYVFAAASRLATRGAGPALFPPWLWGLMALFGGWFSLIAVPLFFALLHYTSWSTPDVDVKWSERGSRASLGSLRAEQAVSIRVAQDDLRAAQEARRGTDVGPGEAPPPS